MKGDRAPKALLHKIYRERTRLPQFDHRGRKAQCLGARGVYFSGDTTISFDV